MQPHAIQEIIFTFIVKEWQHNYQKEYRDTKLSKVIPIIVQPGNAVSNTLNAIYIPSEKGTKSNYDIVDITLWNNILTS